MEFTRRTITISTLAVALLVAAVPLQAEDANAGFVADYLADLERVGGRLVEISETE